MPGARVVDRARAGPGAQPRVASARVAAGRAVRGPRRHRALGASAPHAGPRGAGRSSPSTISISSITPSGRARRSAATTPALAAPHARRAAAVDHHLRLHRGRNRAASRRPARSHRHLLAGRAGLAPRAAAAPRGPILFMGTLEPRKNLGTLLGAYAKLSRDGSGGAAALAGGRNDRGVARHGCARLQQAAARRARDASRLHRERQPLRCLCAGARCWCCPLISKASG